ncbi:MAG: hypothetical protein O7B25_07280 [Gammaproteobacteria bacterium]|nr:hypothetical protein [Gammaproteobacteria bacterium]
MLRLLSAFLLVSLPLVCATAIAKPDRLFASHDPIEITLSAPFRSLSRDRDDEPQDRPATLRYEVDGEAHSVAIGIRPRGKSRRDRSVCNFPPLRLNLPKADVKGTLFAKQDKLKLVTHCKSMQSYQQYVLREYLAYRMFNLLTEASFKVRLLTVNYVDEDRNGKVTTRLGFIIEHKKRVARRLDADLIEVRRVERAKLEPAAASLAELYQFLISNTDFSFIAGPANDRCCHNVVPFATAVGTVIPVPYDFDVSGLVDAPYALPQENLKQRNLKDRLFRGFCRPPPHLDNAVARARSSRDEMYALINDLDGLNEKSQRQLTRFIDGFYQILDEPARYEQRIAGACRG